MYIVHYWPQSLAALNPPMESIQLMIMKPTSFDLFRMTESKQKDTLPVLFYRVDLI
jgi:hypothetical protein